MTTITAPRSENQETKAIVDRWFTEFWGKSWNPSVVDELCAPHMLLQYLLQAPHRGRADVKTFMTELREAFPDISAIANLTVEGDYAVGRWEGGGTHTGPAYSDFLVGCLPAASGEKMRFTGTTVLRVEDGRITEQIGLDDGVTALLQLGLTGAA
jgi:predicted ester cyclase